MARKKINLNTIKEQALEEDLVLQEESSQSIVAMSPAGSSVENTALKPKRKGLLFLALLLIFIILLSITLRAIFPQGKEIPSINITFLCNSDIHISVANVGQFSDRTDLLPGDVLDATIDFWLEPTEETDYSLNNSVFVKTRIYGKLDGKFQANLFGYELDDKWVKSINGYYYYTKIISLAPKGSDPIVESFKTNILIEKTVGNEYQGKTVELCIEFTILQAEYDAIQDVWRDAPYVWQQDMYTKYFAN